jgi:hypothetical protein
LGAVIVEVVVCVVVSFVVGWFWATAGTASANAASDAMKSFTFVLLF